MSGGKADLLERLERLLSVGFQVSTAPSGAKVQLAGMYYLTKALRAAKAARLLMGQGLLLEAFLVVRTLYNSTVDFLWLCQDLEARAERFYNSTAVSIEELFKQHKALGGNVLPATEFHAELNRHHFRQVHSDFQDRRGKIRKEWTPGSIRSRAESLAKANSDLKVLADSYDWLYGTLSDYEHSAPYLAFQYLSFEERTVRGVFSDVTHWDVARRIGNLLDVFIGLTVRQAIALEILTGESLGELGTV